MIANGESGMHMMFVDESGDKGYPHNRNWKTFGGTPIFVRVGAIIHGWKWRAWDERLGEFKKGRGLVWDAEIKASHVRRGEGAFVGWDRAQRDFFLGNLLDLIEGNRDITLLGVVIDKTKVDMTKGERIRRPEIRSMELLLERYNQFLRQQQDKSGIVVLDPTQEDSDDNIRYFQSYLQAHSKNLQPLHIVEGTFFAKSHTSNMIQIADVCTNVLYRKETDATGADAEFARISPRFWRCNSKVAGYGMKRWP
jgi:hypothetical protein